MILFIIIVLYLILDVGITVLFCNDCDSGLNVFLSGLIFLPLYALLIVAFLLYSLILKIFIGVCFVISDLKYDFAQRTRNIIKQYREVI